MSSQDSATKSVLNFTNFSSDIRVILFIYCCCFCQNNLSGSKFSEFLSVNFGIRCRIWWTTHMSGIQNSWYQLKMPSTCAFLHHCSYNFTFFLSSTCVWQINFLCLWRLFSLPSCQKIFISQFFYFSHHMYVKYMYELCKLPFWVSM